MSNYEPKPGDYFTVSTNGPIGFFIQLGTESKDNHSGIYLGNGKIIEATPRRGVIISDISIYKDLVWNRHEGLTDEQRAGIVEEALKFLGAPYSFLAFGVIALRILGVKFLPAYIENILKNAKGVICSELVTTSYRKGANISLSDKPDYFVTPSDLTYRLLYQ